MIEGSGELDKAGAKTQCFFDISLKFNDLFFASTETKN